MLIQSLQEHRAGDKEVIKGRMRINRIRNSITRRAERELDR
jgi:hypothetical protein